MADFKHKLQDIETFVKTNSLKADCGIMLGSGLGTFASTLQNAHTISFSDIPHFPAPTVSGHSGKLIIGVSGKSSIAAVEGRFHYYEGHSALTTTLPVFLMHFLGTNVLIVTNAAGGLHSSYSTGDYVIIKDHINFMGTNPLRELDDHTNRRFVDMSSPYDEKLIEVAQTVSPNEIKEGVLIAFPGPTYETRSEIVMARKLGADLASMSTVPEVIVARYLKMRVLGISFISNVHSAEVPSPVSHDDVLHAAREEKDQFAVFLSTLIEELEKQNELV
jgi:purine-nucleoside phosphorylase